MIPETEWPAIAAALARSNKTDIEQAQRFTALTGLTGANRIELYLEIFCTDQGDPRNPLSPGRSRMRGWSSFDAEQGRVCEISNGAMPWSP